MNNKIAVMKTAYKFLRNGIAPYSNYQWPLPSGNSAGEWVKVQGPLVECRNGLHLCRAEDLSFWIQAELYAVEYRGTPVICGDKIIVRQARLVRKIETWNEKTQRLFAADCAERVLPLFEDKYPKIQAARVIKGCGPHYAEGNITPAELEKARDATWNTTWNTARDTERKWQSKRLLEYINRPVLKENNKCVK